MKDLQDKDREYEEKIRELEEKHTAEIAEYQEKVEQLQQGLFSTVNSFLPGNRKRAIGKHCRSRSDAT